MHVWMYVYLFSFNALRTLALVSARGYLGRGNHERARRASWASEMQCGVCVVVRRLG